MPTVQHMAGAHDARVQKLLDLGMRSGWKVALNEGYEKRLTVMERYALWSQTNLASHDVRNKPDLLFARVGVEPFWLDVKTTTYRADTGNVSVELYPAWRAWTDLSRGITTYFDLDGWLVRADHLRELVQAVVIPQRWREGSSECDLYRRLAHGLRGDREVRRSKVDARNATGDPFVLLPRDALTGRTRPWSARTEAFLDGRLEYQAPNLKWPGFPLAMNQVDPNDPQWTLEKAAHELDFTPQELRSWWERRRNR